MIRLGKNLPGPHLEPKGLMGLFFDPYLSNKHGFGLSLGRIWIDTSLWALATPLKADPNFVYSYEMNTSNIIMKLAQFDFFFVFFDIKYAWSC